jgi:hypothetical protein
VKLTAASIGTLPPGDEKTLRSRGLFDIDFQWPLGSSIQRRDAATLNPRAEDSHGRPRPFLLALRVTTARGRVKSPEGPSITSSTTEAASPSLPAGPPPSLDRS